MTMKPTDTILGPARGSVGDVLFWLPDTVNIHVPDYLIEVYRLAPLVGMDPAILVAQSAHETGDEETGAPWTSPAWVNWLNPAGLGITKKGQDPGYRWANGTDAARAQIVHMAAYVTGGVDVWRVLRPFISLDPRRDAIYNAGWAVTVRTIADLTGKWATDPIYHAKVSDKGNDIFPDIPDQEENPMTLPIPKFEKRIAPRGIPNRTNLSMASPSKITIHEVGNRAAWADADAHVTFVHNGGGGAGVSFHFIAGHDNNDGQKVVQLIELDEACWHASDGYNGPGNRDSIAIETIQIGDFDKTLWSLAWLCAELVVNPGRFTWKNGVPAPYDIDENDFQQHFNTSGGKNCPETIRNQGLWPVLMGRIDQYIALFRNDQNQGPTPVPVPPPPPPAPKPREHTLPKGMSDAMARRLYERYDAPWGESFTFDLGRAAPQVWLARGKRSIPPGGKWTDEGVNWPAIDKVIRQGDGGLLYQWVDGSVYQTRGN